MDCAVMTQATAFEESHDDRNFAAEVHRLSAVCHAERGRLDDACSKLQDAMAVARAQGAATFELRAALKPAEHDSHEGRLALRAVLATFPESAPWPELEAARRVVD
jgi:hypothetical protein